MVQCGLAACMFSIPVSVCFEKPYSRGLVWRCHRWWGCARLATGGSGNVAKPRRSEPMWKGMPDTQLPDNQPIKNTRKSSQEKVQRCPNIVNERFMPDKEIVINSLVKEFLRSVMNDNMSKPLLFHTLLLNLTFPVCHARPFTLIDVSTRRISTCKII